MKTEHCFAVASELARAFETRQRTVRITLSIVAVSGFLPDYVLKFLFNEKWPNTPDRTTSILHVWHKDTFEALTEKTMRETMARMLSDLEHQ